MRPIKMTGSLLLLILMAAATASNAQAECSVCQGGSPGTQQEILNSEWAAFLGDGPANATYVVTTDGLISPKISRQNNPDLSTKSSDPVLSVKNSNGSNSTTNDTASSDLAREPQRSKLAESFLVPVSEATESGILVDISPNSTEYIPGSISIPYSEFLREGGALKSVADMASVLADAGISQGDEVLIYGECQPCGGGPSASTYVYWIMKYLGHERVRLLDGGIDDWVAEKQPTEREARVLPKANYTPTLRSDLLANFEYVKSGSAQVVDARTAEEVSAGSIPGAVNIPYTSVLDGKKIKSETELQKLFSYLNKSRPVVVYTNTGVKASMVWFALMLLDYDARIYSWQDWMDKQPRMNIELREAKAQPNPARTGDPVQITAVFASQNQSSTADSRTVAAAGNETVLTVKGCATCGFGSPQGFADLTKTGGVVQIGSGAQGQKSSDDGFRATALVRSQAGAQVASVVMKRVSGDEFAGIWNANVAGGIYSVDIVASSGNLTETFADALEIQVTGTSKYKNLGTQ